MSTVTSYLDRAGWFALAADTLLKVTFLFVVAALAAALLRHSSAAARHCVWCLAFCGALLAPVLTPALPQWRLPILPAARQPFLESAQAPAPPVAIDSRGTSTPEPHGPAVGAAPLTPRPSPIPRPSATPAHPVNSEAAQAMQRSAETASARGGFQRLEGLLAAIWAAGFVACCLPLLAGAVYQRRLLKEARPTCNRQCLTLLGELCGRLGMTRSVRLYELDKEVIPMAWGILRPLIVLPASCAGWSEQRLRVVLLHELAHVKRLDLPLQLLARIACAVYWFNPLVWYGMRRLGIERERACDDCVVRAGERASDYAAELVSIAQMHRAVRLAGGVAMARTTRLEDRVRRLFDRDVSHGPLTRSGALGLLAAASLVALLTAAAHLAPGDAVADEATGKSAVAAVADKINPAEVRRRIAALAAPDETAPYEERAVNWLSQRRDRILPQLIAGLDDKNPTIAEQCLAILRGAPVSKELTAALIAKAGDEKSPLRYGALRHLEKSAADPRVVRIFDQASAQAETFPDPLVRARWAWLGEKKVRAVEILKPAILNTDNGGYEIVEAIRLLGEIGEPDSVRLLEPIAAGDRWELAVAAYMALARIDPANHGLTRDQMALLDKWRVFKESRESFRQRMQELARLNANELRPLVLQMLRDTDRGGQGAALIILAAWKDKQALPRIRGVMQDTRSNYREQAVVAFLSIDASPRAQRDVLDLLAQSDDFGSEAVLRGIVSVAIPMDRKASMLLAARSGRLTPYSVPHAVRYQMYQGQDIGELLVTLMDKETDLQALAGYCEVAALDNERRFAAQVRRAMKILASEPTVAAGDENTSPDATSAAQTILKAVATYDLKDVAPDVRTLMRSNNGSIRSAAQAAGARLGVPGAMRDLHAQLGADEAAVREQAAQSLSSIEPADETERAAREEAVLSCLGTPAEDFAMRVLVTCGSEKSAQALESILDDPHPQRAVYAAWVLAQMPGKANTAAANKGLRRVAIYAMFHHQLYQQGAGIDFQMAPGLAFHQVTTRLNPGPPADASGAGPVRIPAALLAPFDWDVAEQQFAVRCYQLAEVAGSPYDVSVDFLRGAQVGMRDRTVLNGTHLPLLEEIAAHDSHIARLMVQGQAVAHFEYRQMAARAIAAITSEKATYLGLAGEALDSDAFPKPYKDQDQLLARFFVDRVRRGGLPQNPQKDAEWKQFEIYKVAALQLGSNFGPQVQDAIRQEANRRAVDIRHILPPNSP